MGPRARARGNRLSPRKAPPGQSAALGPRPRAEAEPAWAGCSATENDWLRWGREGARAESRRAVQQPATLGASRGPRAGARGNPQRVGGGRWKRLLQWGRERALAETPSRQ